MKQSTVERALVKYCKRHNLSMALTKQLIKGVWIWCIYNFEDPGAGLMQIGTSLDKVMNWIRKNNDNPTSDS